MTYEIIHYSYFSVMPFDTILSIGDNISIPTLTGILPQDSVAPRQASHKHARVLSDDSAAVQEPRGTWEKRTPTSAGGSFSFLKISFY